MGVVIMDPNWGITPIRATKEAVIERTTLFNTLIISKIKHIFYFT